MNKSDTIDVVFSFYMKWKIGGIKYNAIYS